MMDTLAYILNKYSINTNQRMPVEIPNVGREQLAELFRELDMRVGVEVGVAMGNYSKVILDKNPYLERLYGVDPYQKHKGYKDYQYTKTFERLKVTAHAQLDKYPNYFFIEQFSVEAAKTFNDDSIDFVYIDGDHCFDAVVADLSAWVPKVKRGGIISGDDYFRSKGKSNMHVVDALKGYTNAWGISPWFILGENAMRPGQIRDSGRSWFWVKSY